MDPSKTFTNGSSHDEKKSTDKQAESSSSVDLESLIPSTIPTTYSTTGLEYRLQQLREASAQHSQILTQKLASSQSGQNLLHMGTSLSTLPPDISNLLQHLHPFVATVEQTERDQMKRLEKLVASASKVQRQAHRVQKARAAANLYADLQAAETAVQRYRVHRSQKDQTAKSEGTGKFSCSLISLLDHKVMLTPIIFRSELDEIASLERAAHITVCLLADLRAANEQVRNITTSPGASTPIRVSSTSSDNQAPANVPSLRTSVDDDTETAQFLMKLASRIRRLESNCAETLSQAMEDLLILIQETKEQSAAKSALDNSKPGEHSDSTDNKKPSQPPVSGNSTMSIDTVGSSEAAGLSESDLLIMLGHCMRGMAILGRGVAVESIFARVAIMPLIRSKVSMGRLDEGGSRGECAGLMSLLDEMVIAIEQSYGSILCLAEDMFYVGTEDGSTAMDVDLLTSGVWVPIATALMADTAIKMAIFSPGIASILQANYMALDTFLAELAERLLSDNDASSQISSGSELDGMPQKQSLSKERVSLAQDRVYSHPKTAEFSKRWNLPIYYQLRFGESCARLNKAIEQIKKEGWIAQVFSGSEDRAEELKRAIGFELTLFLELYDIMSDLWRPDVILTPLTNRFLRGAVQLVGRTVSFIDESMEGKIMFGEEPQRQTGENEEDAPPTRALYSWGESEDDVAAVAWELAILDSAIRENYATTVGETLQSGVGGEASELKSLVSDLLREASDQIRPIVEKAWNQVIVKLLTAKCVGPLSAVKGVAVMYRMTNRPPPTQPSSFVGTIFRPLKEFSQSFTNRTPSNVGQRWKQQIVATVSDKYAIAMKELLTTVQRTEEALKNRKARRVAAGGMSDGDKLKLQLYLDYKFFAQSVREVGVGPESVLGVSRLKEMTLEGEAFYQQQPNGI